MDLSARRSLPDDKRAALRARLLAEKSGWYSPTVHLIAPGLIGLAVVAWAIAMVNDPLWWHFLAIPGTVIYANAAEWHIHRDMLHKRIPGAASLFVSHTPNHHMVYVTHDMTMRERREFRLVLIPAYGLFLLAIGIALPATGLWLLVPNLGFLFLATDMSYTLLYEWLHLSYHMPEDSFVGRRKLVRTLARHHALHHDPTRMRHENFNVTVPLWDWLRGTMATVPDTIPDDVRDKQPDASPASHEAPAEDPLEACSESKLVEYW